MQAVGRDKPAQLSQRGLRHVDADAALHPAGIVHDGCEQAALVDAFQEGAQRRRHPRVEPHAETVAVGVEAAVQSGHVAHRAGNVAGDDLHAAASSTMASTWIAAQWTYGKGGGVDL